MQKYTKASTLRKAVGSTATKRMPRLVLATQLLLALWASEASAELPLFPHTYDMQQSTIAMPCNYTGFLDMSGDIGKFGIIDFDW